MEINYKISVIIAVYNGERYILSCVEDLLGQSLHEIDLLLINDGSTDGTAGICDKCAQKDSRVRVFHEPHRGVAHARQVGIENAKGEYTIHIDADDRIAPTMLEEMYDAAKESNADMLICDYREQKTNGYLYHSQKPTALTQTAIIKDLIDGKLYGALWNKLIRTSIFQDNQVYFRQELRMREDMFFIFDVLPYISRIAYLPKAFYTYNRTNNTASLTNTYLCEDYNYYNQEVMWLKTALESRLVSEEQKKVLRSSLLNHAYITLTGDIFAKAEWFEKFSPFQQTFSLVSISYKKTLVLWALTGHYHSASVFRRILAFLGRKK